MNQSNLEWLTVLFPTLHFRVLHYDNNYFHADAFYFLKFQNNYTHKMNEFWLVKEQVYNDYIIVFSYLKNYIMLFNITLSENDIVVMCKYYCIIIKINR